MDDQQPTRADQMAWELFSILDEESGNISLFQHLRSFLSSSKTARRLEAPTTEKVEYNKRTENTDGQATETAPQPPDSIEVQPAPLEMPPSSQARKRRRSEEGDESVDQQIQHPMFYAEKALYQTLQCARISFDSNKRTVEITRLLENAVQLGAQGRENKKIVLKSFQHFSVFLTFILIGEPYFAPLSTCAKAKTKMNRLWVEFEREETKIRSEQRDLNMQQPEEEDEDDEMDPISNYLTDKEVLFMIGMSHAEIKESRNAEKTKLATKRKLKTLGALFSEYRSKMEDIFNNSCQQANVIDAWALFGKWFKRLCSDSDNEPTWIADHVTDRPKKRVKFSESGFTRRKREKKRRTADDVIAAFTNKNVKFEEEMPALLNAGRLNRKIRILQEVEGLSSVIDPAFPLMLDCAAQERLKDLLTAAVRLKRMHRNSSHPDVNPLPRNDLDIPLAVQPRENELDVSRLLREERRKENRLLNTDARCRVENQSKSASARQEAPVPKIPKNGKKKLKKLVKEKEAEFGKSRVMEEIFARRKRTNKKKPISSTLPPLMPFRKEPRTSAPTGNTALDILQSQRQLPAIQMPRKEQNMIYKIDLRYLLHIFHRERMFRKSNFLYKWMSRFSMRRGAFNTVRCYQLQIDGDETLSDEEGPRARKIYNDRNRTRNGKKGNAVREKDRALDRKESQGDGKEMTSPNKDVGEGINIEGMTNEDIKIGNTVCYDSIATLPKFGDPVVNGNVDIEIDQTINTEHIVSGKNAVLRDGNITTKPIEEMWNENYVADDEREQTGRAEEKVHNKNASENEGDQTAMALDAMGLAMLPRDLLLVDDIQGTGGNNAMNVSAYDEGNRMKVGEVTMQNNYEGMHENGMTGKPNDDLLGKFLMELDGDIVLDGIPHNGGRETNIAGETMGANNNAVGQGERAPRDVDDMIGDILHEFDGDDLEEQLKLLGGR